MIKRNSKKSRYLIIGSAVLLVALATWVVYTLVTRARTTPKPELTSISVTVTHPDGSPLVNTSLTITNFGYAWNGMTDKNGIAVVPPQAIASPIKVCALNTPRTTNKMCDLSASVDESGKALDTANTLAVSLHNNFK